MNMIEVRNLLIRAKKDGCKFQAIEAGGRGNYNCEYNPTLRLAAGGGDLLLKEKWSSPYTTNSYNYYQHIVIGDYCCAVCDLDGVTRKLLRSIPIETEADILRDVESCLGQPLG